MSTLAVSDSNELLFVSGKLVLLTGAEETAQKLRNLFQLVKGEWFLDLRVGVPYWDITRLKNPNVESIKRLFRRVILSAQGVKEILELNATLDKGSRELSFTFRVLHDSGKQIVGGSGVPFVVTGAE